jgi:TetR/AcrR family transcriptional regulator, cholesterol catabolism regulator
MGNETALALSKVANEELVSARHAQLVAAATDLFLEKGFHKTSIREVADAVGWNMGTLYLYISCKEDILYLIARMIMHGLAVDQHRVTPRATALETFRAGAEYYFRISAEMHEKLRLVYRESASLRPEHREEVKQAETRVWAYFTDIIRTGIENGEFAPLDARLFAYNVIMLAHMWALKQTTLAQEYAFEPYLDAQLDTLCAQLLHHREAIAGLPPA